MSWYSNFVAKKPSDRYIRFYGPILDALRTLGGSATPREVRAKVLESFPLSEQERNRVLPKSGQNAVENEISWARDFLRRLGLIDGSVAGVWRLTPEGEASHIDLAQARLMRGGVYRMMRTVVSESFGTGGITGDDSGDEITSEEVVATSGLLSVLRALSPGGFERLCQRVLREAGFAEVHVTGQSGDGGIDGHGVLQLNELVSFRVVFQCKRYVGSVGPGEVRDFRGSIETGVDKALLLTTGTFTRAAEAEAAKSGRVPIELVDGERLVRLMERLELGVKPRTVYDVDREFFISYR